MRRDDRLQPDQVAPPLEGLWAKEVPTFAKGSCRIVAEGSSGLINYQRTSEAKRLSTVILDAAALQTLLTTGKQVEVRNEVGKVVGKLEQTVDPEGLEQLKQLVRPVSQLQHLSSTRLVADVV
jgi:hypothetical protein